MNPFMKHVHLLGLQELQQGLWNQADQVIPETIVTLHGYFKIIR